VRERNLVPLPLLQCKRDLYSRVMHASIRYNAAVTYVIKSFKA